MKLTKTILKRTSVFMLVILTLIALSASIYSGMIQLSIKDGYKRLELAAENMAESVSTRFTDQLNLLDYVADAVVLRYDEMKSKETLEYLSSVQASPGTLFDRIDIVFPDGTQLSQAGDNDSFVGIDTFEEMASRGTHVSPRLLDDHTGTEVVYCGAPIEINGEIVAILMGMIECTTLDEQFKSNVYGDETQVIMVDNRDGSYLIDTWHPELSNINQLGDRALIGGKGTVDFAERFAKGESEIVGFVSKTSGKNSYIAYTPVEGFPWMVSIMVTEEAALENVTEVRNMLFVAGIIEVFILIFYICWNIYLVLKVMRNEEQLRLAEVEKTKAQAKDVFLSSVSHDIRTPLNGILGMLTIIKDHDNVPEKTRIALRKIEDSAKYLENLTNDVLDLNEIENGKLELNDDVGNIKDFIDSLSEFVHASAKNKNIEYSVEYKNMQEEKVHFSRVHLQRVLVNLISNAVKYTDAGGKVVLSVEEGAKQDGKCTYIFTVSDNGIGISHEFQKHMFNSFEQENAGARTNNMGHGLGLPIVKKLVDKMGGTIRVESEKGEGSQFIVTLDFKAVEEEQTVVFEEPESKITDLNGVKILVVEDNELNMEIAETLLTAAGAEVVQAYNGKKAVSLFSGSEVGYFNVILMDVMMPVMNGLEATQKIRALNREDAATIPIIAMTARTFSDDIKSCLDAGMNEHMSKPIDTSKLIETIGKYKGD